MSSRLCPLGSIHSLLEQLTHGTAYLTTLSRHHLLIHSNTDLTGSGINKISNMIIQLN